MLICFLWKQFNLFRCWSQPHYWQCSPVFWIFLNFAKSHSSQLWSDYYVLLSNFCKNTYVYSAGLCSRNSQSDSRGDIHFSFFFGKDLYFILVALRLRIWFFKKKLIPKKNENGYSISEKLLFVESRSEIWRNVTFSTKVIDY